MVIHGFSNQLQKIYCGTISYQYDTPGFLGSLHFSFGRNTILKFSAIYRSETIITFLVSVKMHAKVIPTNGKQILNSQLGYLPKLQKNIWDHVGASRNADFILYKIAPSSSFKGIYLTAPIRSH